MTANHNPHCGVYYGVVTSIDDDQHLGRVKVKIPTVSGDVAIQARVTYPGAGKNRGFYVVPEVDDQVLVAFEHGDASRPIVLGGVYNSMDTPKNASDAIDGGLHSVKQRTWTSRKGHQIMLSDDDSAESITIKSEDGNFTIVIDETSKKVTIQSGAGNVEVTAAQAITLEAQQGDVTIKADTGKITLQADVGGVTVQSEAGNVNLEGLQASLKGTAGTTIQGATVSIN